MDFINASNVAAGWTMGFERDGRELVIVTVKATYLIPDNGQQSMLSEEQVPLVEADEFFGDPGLSAPLHESDYAHRKPMCDVLLNGSAYAPGGRAVRQIPVTVKVGTMQKSFNVLGPRVWSGTSATGAQQAEVIPFSYGSAFGGADLSKPDHVRTYLPNPVGVGYSFHKKGIDGTPMPNTEEFGRSIDDPSGDYRPMSFGTIGRSWQPRAALAGTYDDAWLDNRAPFWPDDFDYRYFQSAPTDQQIPHPRGGEEVILQNLTPEGLIHFTLPLKTIPVLFIPSEGRDMEVNAVLDTIVIEPDLGRYCLTWRAGYPTRKSCFDLMRVVAGKTAREFHARQRFGAKPYYRNLAELVKARRGS